MITDLNVALEAYQSGDRDLSHMIFDNWAEAQLGLVSASGPFHRPATVLARTETAPSGPQDTDALRQAQAQDINKGGRPLTDPSYTAVHHDVGEKTIGTDTSSSAAIDNDDWDFESKSDGGQSLTEERGVTAEDAVGGEDELKVQVLTSPKNIVDRVVRTHSTSSGAALDLNPIRLVAVAGDEDGDHEFRGGDGTVAEAEAVPEDWPCASCGNAQNAHPYRHRYIPCAALPDGQPDNPVSTSADLEDENEDELVLEDYDPGTVVQGDDAQSTSAPEPEVIDELDLGDD